VSSRCRQGLEVGEAGRARFPLVQDGGVRWGLKDQEGGRAEGVWEKRVNSEAGRVREEVKHSERENGDRSKDAPAASPN
jgi:hypothetical protein